MLSSYIVGYAPKIDFHVWHRTLWPSLVGLILYCFGSVVKGVLGNFLPYGHDPILPFALIFLFFLTSSLLWLSSPPLPWPWPFSYSFSWYAIEGFILLVIRSLRWPFSKRYSILSLCLGTPSRKVSYLFGIYSLSKNLMVHDDHFSWVNAHIGIWSTLTSDASISDTFRGGHLMGEISLLMW